MTETTPQGTPCWYELSTSDLTAAGEFYSAVLGWNIVDSGMPGMTYHLASAPDGGGVAGLMGPQGRPDAPPSWLLYFTSDDVDTMAASVTAAGGSVLAPPADIPGTGRFAVVTDPQGAAYGLLQPLPMDTPPASPAFDQSSVGHGTWHELMSTDPTAGFAFYADQFGWSRGEAMDMGDMGFYQLFQLAGTEIGGMMGLGQAPQPAWLPYFGVTSVAEAVDRITGAGGTIHHGPADIPGGAQIALANDPQGAWFAVLGPR
ncbi:MAG: VOC family protein [Nostocoides sp.]